MGRPIVDYTGQRFGPFVVLGPPTRAPGGRNTVIMWPSKCNCGAVRLMKVDHLRKHVRNGCTACLGGIRSQEQSVQIRALLSQGVRQSDVARRFGVQKSVIQFMLIRLTPLTGSDR